MILFRPLARYADFRGRASRSEYTLFLLSQGVIYFLCATMAFVSLSHGSAKGLLGLFAWLAVALILMVVLAIPNYAILARRLHDIGVSALWMALMLPGLVSQVATFQMMGSLAGQIPTAGTEAGGAALLQTIMAQAGGAGLLAVVAMVSNAALLIMSLRSGNRGPNRFGPDPKDPTAGAQDAGGPDMDRWDALIAEAKRGSEPYKPVFDFGPGPVAAEPVSQRPVEGFGQPQPVAQGWDQGWDRGVTPAPTFGRRRT